MKRLALLGILWASCLLSQRPDASTESLRDALAGGMLTSSVLNGHWWATAEDRERSNWMTGFAEALMLANVECTLANAECKCHRLWPKGTGTTTGAMVLEFNVFYAQKENRRIPLLFVLRAIAKRLDGRYTKAEYESEVTAMRKVSQ